MKEINYKSDFDFILTLKTCNGADIGFPDYDWEANVFTVSNKNGFKVSCIGGVCTNCYNDEGRIHVVCDNHGLLPGELRLLPHLPRPRQAFATRRFAQV